MVAEKQVCVIEAIVRGISGHPLSSPVPGGTTAKLANLLRHLDKCRLPVHITPEVRTMYRSIALTLPFPSNLMMRLLLNPILTDRVLTGITDARLFPKLGIQTYGFLPMNLPSGFNFSQTLHAPDKRIPAEALVFGKEAIYKLFQRFGK